MKKNLWLILGMMVATAVSAQTLSNQPAAAPVPATPPAAEAIVTNAPPAAPQTNAPAPKSGKKKSSTKKKAAPKPAKKQPAFELRTVPLVAGPAIVDASNVNVRGQAKLKSEVVTRLTKGDQVTVLEEIVRNNSGPDEPSAWAKILLPPKAHGWVNTAFIDATNKTVVPKRLNVRSGPGENFSILGRMEHGDAVKEIGTKGEWTEIEPPTNAYAFMAAQYLKQEPPGTVATTTTPPPTTPEPMPTPTPVTEPPPVANPPTDAPVTNPPTIASTTPTPVPAPPTQPAVDEPPPKRIVQHEGVVRGLTSIQAPSRFALISPDTGKTINYLYTTSKDLDLRRYKGLRIVVTGEEGLDERWGNTPVITIQKIQVVE